MCHKINNSIKKYTSDRGKNERGINMKYAYIRTSTREQHINRQVEAMKKYDIPEENYYIEQVSGKNMERTELQKLLAIVKPGDTIHIHDFSRLSRSTSDLLKIVYDLNDKGVYLVSNKENFDTSTPTGRLMLTMIAAINSFERECMLERAAEGIAIAKANGKYKKRDIDMDQFRNLKEDVDKGLLTVTTAAEELGITRRTWYLKVKSLEEETA